MQPNYLAFDGELRTVGLLEFDDVALVRFVPDCAEESAVQSSLGLQIVFLVNLRRAEIWSVIAP